MISKKSILVSGLIALVAVILVGIVYSNYVADDTASSGDESIAALKNEQSDLESSDIVESDDSEVSMMSAFGTDPQPELDTEQPVDDSDEDTAEAYANVKEVQAVTYQPDSESFIGFRECDDENSQCTVYGVPSTEVSDIIPGTQYTISYNNTAECSAAAGTSYCEVLGDFELK